MGDINFDDQMMKLSTNGKLIQLDDFQLYQNILLIQLNLILEPKSAVLCFL